MTSSRFNTNFALIGVVVLAGLLRLVGLDAIPPGINQDEALNAYEAYCIRTTGQDHHQTPWPLFFRAFGPRDYRSGHFIYLLTPIQSVCGMNVWSTRLPSALLGTLNVWFLYLLVARLYSRRTALLASILLAVSPWHLHISRLGHEASICPPLVTLALLLLVQAVKGNDKDSSPALPPRHVISLAASGLIFGLVLWTYQSMRVFIPLMLVGAAILYAARIRSFASRQHALKGMAAFLAALAVGAAPFVWTCLNRPERMWGRALTESTLGQASNVFEALTSMLSVYAMHLSPSFLFITGDPSLTQSVPDYGQLHHYCIVLLPIGLYRLIRRWRTEPFGRLILWWILIAPIAPAFTKLDAGHALRSAAVLPAYQILAAIGLDLLLTAASSFSTETHRLAVRATALVITLNTAVFLYLFAVRYPPAAAEEFQTEWAELYKDLQHRRSNYDAIMLTPRRVNKPGMLYLFWTNMDPRQYFDTHPKILLDRGWDRILQIDNVYFLPGDWLERILPELPAGAKVLIAERPNIPIPGTELARFYRPNGTLALILYHLQT